VKLRDRRERCSGRCNPPCSAIIDVIAGGTGIRLQKKHVWAFSATWLIRFAGMMLFAKGCPFLGSTMTVSRSKEEKSPFRNASVGTLAVQKDRPGNLFSSKVK